MSGPELPDNATDDDVEKLVWSQLKTCFDPEIPVNIVELGLVYEVQLTPTVEGKRDVAVKLTLTAPGCGMGDTLVGDVTRVLQLVPTVAEVDVELTFDPPWNRDMMSDVAKLETGML
jgi:probable FeS assembly SUF system protein SufT